MNTFLAKSILNLNIMGYKIDTSIVFSLDEISNIISKFKNHRSGLKIKGNIHIIHKGH